MISAFSLFPRKTTLTFRRVPQVLSPRFCPAPASPEMAPPETPSRDEILISPRLGHIVCRYLSATLRDTTAGIPA
jgi:hypothetical protein